MNISEYVLEELMRAQMAHVHRMTADLHLSDDGCDDLSGGLRLANDLLESWYGNKFERAGEILTEDYLLANYGCDGICNTVYDFAERNAPSKP